MPQSASSIFGREKALIGMVHVAALPGTPNSELSIDQIAQQAATEAKLLADVGFDCLMIENMHDTPYIWGGHSPETTAAMTRIGLAVQADINIPLGVQVLSGGHREALAIAQAIGANFIRVENFAFAHVADEGLITKAVAGELLRYRRSIGAQNISILADIKKKHASHAITADLSIEDQAEICEFFGADGIIVTGTATGKPTDPEEVKRVKQASSLPVLVGSGVTPQSAPELLAHADALIVGSWYKESGKWLNSPDLSRAVELAKAVQSAR